MKGLGQVRSFGLLPRSAQGKPKSSLLLPCVFVLGSGSRVKSRGKEKHHKEVKLGKLLRAADAADYVRHSFKNPEQPVYWLSKNSLKNAFEL